MPKGTRINRCIFRDSTKVRAAIEMMMKRKGWSKSELSRASGVHLNLVIKYLNNHKYSVSQAQLINICDALGIDLDVQITFR